MIRGVRGATTTQQNDAKEIIEKTEILLNQMIQKNNIQPDDVISIFFSVTDDLTEAFPAQALRNFNGWSYVPVMCMKEIPVPDSLGNCIRVMMHIFSTLTQQEIRHIYLEKATCLRPDLNNEE